jgi:catalase
MSDAIKIPLMTHAAGTPVTDNVNIQTAGPRGQLCCRTSG